MNLSTLISILQNALMSNAKKSNKKKQSKPVSVVMLIIAIIVAVAVLYYIFLPAINIHSIGTWNFIFIVAIIIIFLTFKHYLKFSVFNENNELASPFGIVFKSIYRAKLIFKIEIIIFLILIAIRLIGGLASTEIFNAHRYANLINVKSGTFMEDVKPTNFNTVPLLDKNSAELLGDREMGSMADMVSQFEVANDYSQINVDGIPVRVSPLKYASIIKWLANFQKGIPAYANINMTNQNASIDRLKNGMKYTPYDHFNRYLMRHLRFRFPTYIFFEQQFFEVDDHGTPYFVCPVKAFKIGLFGGVTVGRVVLVNAITGEMKDYAVKDVPRWVDKVYSAELLVNLYNYHGMLQNGFFNSKLSQKGCLHTTNGYNYLALDDDVWVYTGVTSAASDQSIVGFVLMNQRTGESKFYGVEGANEASAMASAEGQVQNLRYMATFPILLNVSNRPTYFMALKDSSGLVKKYALVNVEKYQMVAIGDTIAQCRNNYISLLRSSGLGSDLNALPTEEATGIIHTMVNATINGNSHFYVSLENDKRIFDIDLADPLLLNIVRYRVGDTITLHFVDENGIKEVKGEIK